MQHLSANVGDLKMCRWHVINTTKLMQLSTFDNVL